MSLEPGPYAPGDYPVVIVGTGPGSIQVAYDLRRLGIRFALISADEGPGGMFRRYPMFDRLNTSSRPHGVIPRESPDYYRFDHNSLLTDSDRDRALVPEFMDGTDYFPSRSEMQQGLAAFVERSGLEARYGCRWESTSAVDGRFVIGTSSGEYRCEVAVFGTGMAEPWRPPVPGIEQVPHYVDLEGRTLESFKGKRVFVIGKRNSAFEVANELLPWASQIVLGSPHTPRPSVLTGVPTPPKARYLEVLEDHCFGGGTFVVDCAIERIEPCSEGWRVHTQGTTRPGELVFTVDEVIATTGFQTPLGDLRELGVETFFKDRLPTQNAFWESTSIPGIFFAGATTQGQAGLRKYGYPSRSASVAGFRYNSTVQAFHIARRFGVEIPRPQLRESDVIPFLLDVATRDPGIWSQQTHLARILSFEAAAGIRDDGLLPLAPFVDSGGSDGVAITVETDPEQNIQPAVYVRRNGATKETVLSPAFQHDFRTDENRARLTELLSGLVRSEVQV